MGNDFVEGMGKGWRNFTPDSDSGQRAQKLIDDWGSEGVESASALVGESVAQGMLQSKVARNLDQMYPGVKFNGDESEDEIKAKVRAHKKSLLTPGREERDCKSRSPFAQKGIIGRLKFYQGDPPLYAKLVARQLEHRTWGRMFENEK